MEIFSFLQGRTEASKAGDVTMGVTKWEKLAGGEVDDFFEVFWKFLEIFKKLSLIIEQEKTKFSKIWGMNRRTTPLATPLSVTPVIPRAGGRYASLTPLLGTLLAFFLVN